MSHGDRSARLSWRNVHVYDAATQNYLGGVHTPPSGLDLYAAQCLVDHSDRKVVAIPLDHKKGHGRSKRSLLVYQEPSNPTKVLEISWHPAMTQLFQEITRSSAEVRSSLCEPNIVTDSFLFRCYECNK